MNFKTQIVLKLFLLVLVIQNVTEMVSANGSIDLMERLKVPPRFGKRTVQQGRQ